MKFLFFLGIFAFVFEFVLCSVSYALPSKRTDCSSGQCIDYCDFEEANLVPGDTFTYRCNLVRCNVDFSMNFESCGVASTEDCRRFGPDTTLDYPLCCNKICVEPTRRRQRPYIETNQV